MQGRGTNPALDSAQPESLFRDHVNDLHKRACAGFVDLMDAMLKPLLPPAPQPVRAVLVSCSASSGQHVPPPCRLYGIVSSLKRPAHR